jgi:hypothetical protein
MNENLKKVGITFLVVVAGLAFYQVVVAPRLVKKTPVATK